MKWIKENIDFIGKRLHVPDPEAEHEKAVERIRKFHPVGNQCIYALSYFDDKLIYLSENVEDIFGFRGEEVQGIDFFYNLIHPDDIDRVKEITIQGIRAGSSRYNIHPMDHVFHIIYRMRNSSGDYLKFQRQTGMLTRDKFGNMLTSFGILTNVTHLDRTDEIQSFMTGPDIPGYRFLDPSPESDVSFTKREQEIIDLLAKGLNSDEIGHNLYISEHTVYTHRRNILKKAGVKNTAGLMTYVFKNGY